MLPQYYHESTEQFSYSRWTRGRRAQSVRRGASGVTASAAGRPAGRSSISTAVALSVGMLRRDGAQHARLRPDEDGEEEGQVDAAIVGVIVGGVLGVGGTLGAQLLANVTQRESRRRAELLPIAARALKAAQDSWEMMRGNAIWTHRGGESAAGMSAADYLIRYTEAHDRLTLALDELTLLVPGIDPAAEELRETLALGTLLPGDQHRVQEQAYKRARGALHDRLRRFLDT